MNKAIQFDLHSVKYLFIRVRLKKELNVAFLGLINDQAIVFCLHKRKILSEVLKKKMASVPCASGWRYESFPV